ncbi:MAG TPA: rhomboid family intramembrane serine protease [Thermoleophilia bacterium]|nr:rhomboid family intramembrane serine protease [Thermoleophilia bacterium]
MLPVYSHEARTYRWPYATITLIGINVLAFVFELSVGARFVPFLQEWGLVPARVNAEVTSHNLLTLVTAMFLHVGWIHLVGNMWFLFVFGDAVEDAFGWRWFVAIYLLSGFFANIAFMVATSSSSIPAIGASGAIAGVMGASLVLWPTARLKIFTILLMAWAFYLCYEVLVAVGTPSIVLGGSVLFVLSMIGSVVWYAAGRQRKTGQGFVYTLFVAVTLPAWVVLGLFFLTNLWSGALSVVSPAYGGAVGWWAHIGGFVAGAILAKLFPKHPIVLAKRALLG